MAVTKTEDSTLRIDKWLWAARFFNDMHGVKS
jgi:ribosomal 50S subunit-recycling heat shock protein